MTRRLAPLLTTLACLCLAASAHAQEGMQSVRSTAMADAFVGGGTGNGAIFHNPAGLAIASVYSFEAGYHHDWLGGQNSFGASVADSKTNPYMAGGLSFVYAIDGGEERGRDLADFRGYDARVALAFPLVPETLALGVTGHYLNHRHFVLATDESGEEVIVTDDNNAMTLDLGVTGALNRNVVLGFSAQNLVNPNQIPYDRQLNTGVGFYIERLHMEAAWAYNVDTRATRPHTFAVGAEYTIEVIPIRIGYRNDGPTEAQLLTGGFGYRNERGGFDVAYVQSVRESNHRALGVTLSLYL